MAIVFSLFKFTWTYVTEGVNWIGLAQERYQWLLTDVV